MDQPVDDVSMMRGAIRGMLESLGDEHTTYMDPEEYEQASIGLTGEYEGIGAWVDTDGEFLTIVAPMPESPAEKAGIRAGDVVIAVDGEDMTGIDASLVVQRVLGPQGTTVRLTIRREGVEKPFDVDVIRDSIIVPSVESRMLENVDRLCAAADLRGGDHARSEAGADTTSVKVLLVVNGERFSDITTRTGFREFYNFLGGAEAHVHYSISSRADLMIKGGMNAAWYSSCN